MAKFEPIRRISITILTSLRDASRNTGNLYNSLLVHSYRLLISWGSRMWFSSYTIFLTSTSTFSKKRVFYFFAAATIFRMIQSLFQCRYQCGLPKLSWSPDSKDRTFSRIVVKSSDSDSKSKKPNLEAVGELLSMIGCFWTISIRTGRRKSECAFRLRENHFGISAELLRRAEASLCAWKDRSPAEFSAGPVPASHV